MLKYISKPLFIALFFLCFLCLSTLSMGQIRKLAVSSDSIASIGDQIELTVSLSSAKKENFLFPTLSDTIDKRIEFFPNKFKLDTLFDEKTKEYTYQKTFVFSVYEEGMYEIPPMYFLLKVTPSDSSVLEFAIPAIKYTITAPLVDTNSTFKDIKPVFTSPYTFGEIFPWIAIPLGIIALIVFLIYYLRKRKKNQPLFKIAPKPAPPADILALEKLNTLHSKKLWQKNLVKEYYTELTDIIRVYIESELHIPTLEKTTDEILNALYELRGSKDEVYRLLESILLPSVMVKFAKDSPLPEQHETAYKNALTFVNTVASEKKNIHSETNSSTESLNN